MPMVFKVKCPKCGSPNCETFTKEESPTSTHKYYDCPDCGYSERIIKGE